MARAPADPNSYRERFLRLAKELENLASGLDTAADECKHCGANRFRSFEEELAARKLLGWADSLQNLANGAGRNRNPPAYLNRPAPTGIRQV